MAPPALCADILMVTASGSLTSEESARQSQFESWGHAVTTIVDSDSQADYDAAMASADVVYVPEDASASSVGYKLRMATIGVISEEPYLDLEFGFATSDGTESSGSTILVTDNSHEISSGLSTGYETIFSSSQPRALLSGTAASGLQELAIANTGSLVLGYIETGGALANTYSGNSTAAGRRVRLPWGGGSFSFSSLDSDGLSILQNAIDWAGGTGGGGASLDEVIYLSTTGSATLASVSFNDEDIVAYDSGAGSATVYLDGTTPTGGVDVDAVHLNGDGTFLLSINSSGSIGGVSVEDEDVVEYDPDTGAGTMVFEGDLVFAFDEELNAVCRLPNGNLLFSTENTASIGSTYFDEADLVEYDTGAGTASIYFDGDAVFSSAFENIDACHVKADGKILLSTTGDAQIGSLSFGDDDIVEYNPATGTAVIVFNGGTLFSNTSEDVDAASGDPATQGLMAHWRFDEGTGTTAADDTGNGHDASFDAGTPQWISGVRGGAVEFDGASDIETDSDFDPPETGSIAFWFRPDVDLSGRILGLAGNWEIRLEGTGAVACDLSGSEPSASFKSAEGTAEVGRWTHVVAIYNGADDTHKLYINGQLDSEGAFVCGDLGAAPLAFGTRRDQPEFFAGALDDVRVYDTELTGPEVAELYGLVGHWKLDETSGTVAVDSTLNSNDGAHNSGVAVNAPGPNSGDVAAEYDGSNNFTDIGMGGDWNPVDDSFSLAAWVRIDADSDEHGLIIWSNVASPYALLVNSSNQPEVRVNWGSVSGGSGNITHAATSTLSAGLWAHVAVTYDGSTVRFYVNGQEDAGTLSSSVTIGTSTDKMQLGGDDGSSYDLTGALFDARVYNRAILPEEVSSIAGEESGSAGVRIMKWVEVR